MKNVLTKHTKLPTLLQKKGAKRDKIAAENAENVSYP